MWMTTMGVKLDDATREFLQKNNPAALHDLLERLLEAMQRGLWQAPGDYAPQIQNHLLDLEAQQEGGTHP